MLWIYDLSDRHLSTAELHSDSSSWYRFPVANIYCIQTFTRVREGLVLYKQAGNQLQLIKSLHFLHSFIIHFIHGKVMNVTQAINGKCTMCHCGILYFVCFES